MVMFMAPQDGSTVPSPVHIMFGSEHFEIAAVPQGTVETARPGMGHYHVAVDSTCLPTGEVIPKAAPWTHFGDGKNMIDMQLLPGKHTLTVQIGDDMHRTIEGLCKTISVTVQSPPHVQASVRLGDDADVFELIGVWSELCRAGREGVLLKDVGQDVEVCSSASVEGCRRACCSR